MSNEENKSYKLVDEIQREKIKFELDRNFMVEAGAGSGKTTALVQRMVNQIIVGKFKAEEIVAITFTVKAGEELKNRFHTELEKTYRLMVDLKDNKYNYSDLIKDGNINDIEDDLNKGITNVEIALKDIDKCYMGTIHSFCSKLLRERPIEANVSPIFTEMDEIKEDKFRVECWREFIKNKYKNNSSEIKNINGYLKKIRLENSDKDISIDDLIDTYKRLCEYEDIDIEYKKFNNDDEILEFYRDEIEDKYNKFIEIAKELNEKYIPRQDELKNYDRTNHHPWEERIFILLSKYKDIKTLDNKINIIKETIKSIDTKKGYRGSDNEKKEARELTDKLEAIKKDIVEIEFNKYTYYAYDKCMKFIKHAVDYYNLRKKQESKLGFQDLLIKARNLLRDNSEARKYFGNKYKYLLIDEFQDTDPIQAEIMLFLTSEDKDGEERDWRELHIKKGSLFIVGDPKQSIYRFRNADISIYNEVKNIIEKNEDKGILKLTTNFRTIDTICDWFNKKLKELLKDDEKYQAKFEAMEYVKKSQSNEVPIYQLIIDSESIVNSDSDEDNKVKNNRLAAEKIAQYIKQTIASNKSIVRKNKLNNKEEKIDIKYKDFMILTKGKQEVEIYVKELENQGIPCVGTGKFTLGNNYIIKSLINLLKFINDQRDKVSYIGALKGCFGVSDKMLLEEYKENPYFNFIYKKDNKQNEEIKEEKESNSDLIQNANRKINKYIYLKKSNSPITILEKIIEDLNLMPWILIDENNKNAYKEIYNIIERLKSDEECCYDFNNMVKKIEEICTKEEKEISQVNTEELNAVRVMNVHQSKGLEAEIVILASPKLYSEKPVVEKEVKYIDYTDFKCKGYFVIAKENLYNPKSPSILLKPVEWKKIEEKAKKYNDAENKRLQYVAATRAKQELIIVCNDENDDNWAWKDLYDKELKELIIEEKSSKEEIKQDEESGQDIFNIIEWQKALKEKTYEFKTPTDYTNKSSKNIKIGLDSDSVEKDNNQEDKEAKTAEWGTIVHKIFEKLVKDEGCDEDYLEQYIKYELKNSQQYSENIKKSYDELRAEVDRFKDSDIYKLIEDAKKNNRKVYSELSFGVKVENVKGLRKYLDENTKQGCGEKEVCINGVIDLIIEGADGWYIVDYKSNRVNDIDEFAKKAKMYAPQLNIYKIVWEHLSKEKVSKVMLYSTLNGSKYLIN